MRGCGGPGTQPSESPTHRGGLKAEEGGAPGKEGKSVLEAGGGGNGQDVTCCWSNVACFKYMNIVSFPLGP